MPVYWKDVRMGQNLILSDDERDAEVIGGYRETKRGIDAYAKTFGYDPGRSQKDFATVADARAFVESFRPWELYGAEDVTVDPELGAAPGLEDIANPGPSVQSTESVVPEHPPGKNGGNSGKGARLGPH